MEGGIVNVVCFDKTGTLTEDGMSLKGIFCKEGKEIISKQKILDFMI